jgi:hypothetical protein
VVYGVIQTRSRRFRPSGHELPDGKRAFSSKDNPEHAPYFRSVFNCVLLSILESVQLPMLTFVASAQWIYPWLQLRHLQSSAMTNDKESGTTSNGRQVTAVNNYYVQNGATGIAVPIDGTAGWQQLSGVPDVAPRGIYDLAQETTQKLLKMRDTKKRNLMLGIMVKLNEASKGNLESVSGMSLENVFNDYMTTFTQPTARIELFY